MHAQTLVAVHDLGFCVCKSQRSARAPVGVAGLMLGLPGRAPAHALNWVTERWCVFQLRFGEGRVEHDLCCSVYAGAAMARTAQGQVSQNGRW